MLGDATYAHTAMSARVVRRVQAAYRQIIAVVWIGFAAMIPLHVAT